MPWRPRLRLVVKWGAVGFLVLTLLMVAMSARQYYALRRDMGVAMKWREFLPQIVFMTIGLVPPLSLVVFLWHYDRRKFPPSHCQDCGYDLTGNESGRCPECGTGLPTESNTGRLDANRWLPAAYVMACVFGFFSGFAVLTVLLEEVVFPVERATASVPHLTVLGLEFVGLFCSTVLWLLPTPPGKHKQALPPHVAILVVCIT